MGKAPTDKHTQTKQGQAGRKARLAAALRANLKRRKATRTPSSPAKQDNDHGPHSH